jgi:peroxiredoxin
MFFSEDDQTMRTVLRVFFVIGTNLGRGAFIAFCAAVIAGSSGFVNAEAPDTSLVTLPPVLLQMIRDDAVHSELKLSATQKTKTREAIESIDPRWWLARHLKPAPLAAELDELTTTLRTKLGTFLDATQMRRLAELERQAVGTRMVIRSDVSEEIALTEIQREQLMTCFATTDNDANRIQTELSKGEIDSKTAQTQLEGIKKSERQKIVEVLSDAQKVQLAKLSGQPFDFSQVRRTYPLAPEIERDGVTWIQGGPLQLKELEGKVVAVHFYAFQCINCQRNFPHYEAWHRDFADRGLVVIGMQTPETSAERDINRVKSAVVSDGFAFPVLMDASASNWKAWGNTMWPSVYLIDKQGFIRRWWQGEMNWQGTEGEKQMRETIELLLNE